MVRVKIISVLFLLVISPGLHAQQIDPTLTGAGRCAEYDAERIFSRREKIPSGRSLPRKLPSALPLTGYTA
jgi:hypothetical protein